MKPVYFFAIPVAIIIFASSTCNNDDLPDPCILSASIEVTVSTPTNHLHAIAVDGLEPYTYLWSTGETTEIIEGDSLLSYSVTVTDDAGCTAFATCGSTSCPATVTDVDGNVYNVVHIGSQCWTKENYRVTKLNDGTGIAENEDSIFWVQGFITGIGNDQWCYYGENATNDAIYGKLYNWYAVNNSKFCPDGWHVPTKTDYDQLINYLGGPAVAGGKLKALTNWFDPNTGATNSSGFTALPAGLRFENAPFANLTFQAFFWTNSAYNDANAYYINLFYDNATELTDHCSKFLGFSVRLVHY